jgi:hypothetical protein
LVSNRNDDKTFISGVVVSVIDSEHLMQKHA